MINTIVPTGVTEDARRPGIVPEPAVIIVEEDGSIWATTEQVEGVPFVVDGAADPRLVIISTRILALA